jgi:transcriptional regulator with XRE-family HTH domain
MSFSNKLKQLMRELSLSQTKLSELTGIGKSSISQYLSGKNEPTKDRKREIAKALGVKENYFEVFDINAAPTVDKCVNLPVVVAAQLMHKSKKFIMQGLRDGLFPWGYAVKLKDWSYFISSVKFTEYTGIEIPFNQNESDEVSNETV